MLHYLYKNFNFKLMLFFFFFLLFKKETSAIFTDIYNLSEDNAVASSLCKAINFAQTAMIPIAGIMLSVAAFGAFKGSFSPSMLITFAIGIGIARNPGPLLAILSPDSSLQYACKCQPVKKVAREVRDSNNVVHWQEFHFTTGVDENCNPIK